LFAPHNRFRPITTDEYFQEKEKQINDGERSVGVVKIWKTMLCSPERCKEDKSLEISVPALEPDSSTASGIGCAMQYGSETLLSALTSESLFSTEAAIGAYQNYMWNMSQGLPDEINY
jgi:hypothetical protein